MKRNVKIGLYPLALSVLFGCCSMANYAQSLWQYLSPFNHANSAVWMSSGAGNTTYAITSEYELYYSADA